MGPLAQKSPGYSSSHFQGPGGQEPMELRPGQGGLERTLDWDRAGWGEGLGIGFLTLCLPEEHWSHALGTGSGLFPQWEMKIS